MLFPVNEIRTDFTLCHKLIYGFPKSGKTTLAAQMSADGRQPLFLMTEEGASSMRVSSTRLSGWDGFIRCLTYLENNKTQLTNEHSTIVVDLVGDLDAWSQNHIARQKKIEHVADLDGGKGWTLHRQNINEALSRLLALAPITFIAHSQEKSLTLNGEKVTGQAPSLSKACFEFINGKVDAIIWIDPANSKKEHPRISMVPNVGAIAGSRQKSINKTYIYDPADPAHAYQQVCADYEAGQRALITNNAEATAPAQP